MSDGFSGAATATGWLEPLAGDTGPCGADLEYDNDFLSLTQAAAGRPETQFEAAVPPDWRTVRTLAEALLGRTRDLRIAVTWLRACLNLDGFAALPAGLDLLRGLLDRFWDTLHPLPDPDDGDPYARMNALAELRDPATVLADVRRAVLFTARGFGEIRVRTVEVVLGHVPARDDEQALGRDQFSQMYAAAIAQQPALRGQPAAALAAMKALAALVDERVGSAGSPDLKPLQSLLYALTTAVPAEEAAAPEAADAPADADVELPAAIAPARGAAAARGLSGGVHSRDDALRAIDMVCDFLERTEPTNPAPLLLRRARKLVNQNFLQLMKELAPDALAEVARVMGVDPESVQIDS